MRRRNRSLDQRQTDSNDRWLVSYADFITLLFAFFVVMYAMSTVSEGKYNVLRGSLVSAFRAEAGGPPIEVAAAPPELPPRRAPRLSEQARAEQREQREQREQMRGIAEGIRGVLDQLVQDGHVKVTQSIRGVSVEINASVLFASGQAQLRADSVRALGQVARVLSGAAQGIQVEGYTDNAPISTSQFPSNWELSAARAASVVRLFIDSGVAQQRLSVIGYGPNRPVSHNDTPEERARNRRVTVMILAEAPDTPIDVPLPSAAQTR